MTIGEGGMGVGELEDTNEGYNSAIGRTILLHLIIIVVTFLLWFRNWSY